jgi:predicted MFS family arabinose efflux permease
VALACAVAQAFGRFSYALLLPAIDRDLLGSYALAGLLATLNVAAYLIGTLAVSGLARRADPVRLILAGLACSTLGLTLLWQAGGFNALAAGLSLTGFGGALIWVPAPGLAASVVHPARRGAAIGMSGSGIGLGIMFASGLSTLLERTGGTDFWRTVWLVEAGVALATLVLGLLLLRPAPEPDGPAPRPGALRRVPGWFGLVGAFAMFGIAYSIYTTYVVTLLVDDASFTASHAALDFTLFGLAWVFGGPLLGPLSDRVGRGRTLVVGYVGMAGAILLALMHAEPFAAASTLAFGICMSGLPAVIAAQLSDHLSPREFAGAFGRLTLCFGVAQLLGPPLGGWLAERAGSFTLPFLVAAGAALVGSACALNLPRPRSTGSALRHQRSSSG